MPVPHEDLKEIEKLPIFPLPLVLMPNEVLPLHIFEPRYREMLADVQNSTGLFGVSYFETEGHPAEHPDVGSVGCVAEIRDVQMLEDGRANIITTGKVRYRILEYSESDEPYLVARVDVFHDEAGSGEEIAAKADQVFTLFERIAKAAFELGGASGPLPAIKRSDPESLSFLVSTSLDLSNQLKYDYLEMTSTSERLERLRLVLIEAVDRMEENAEVTKAAKTNGHSKKKLEL